MSPLQPAPMRILLSTLLVILAGTVQAAHISPRDSQEDPVAGKILAIILGSVVGGLALAFALFCLWLWRRIKKNKRLEAEAERAREEGRTSADTVVEGRDNELRVLGQREPGKENGDTDKTPAETTQTAV